MAVATRVLFLVLCLAAMTRGAAGRDWPCYGGDIARSCVSKERLPFPLSVAWTHRFGQPPDPAWPEPGRELNRLDFDYAFQPVVADGLLFVGSSADDTVRALDAASGRARWAFTTGGPVRLAPHIAAGLCLVASDDGWVYALDARSGELRWDFRAAFDEQRVIGNGRMISRWPCRAGVLVDGGVVYVAAGMWPAAGIFLYALDAKTGRELWCNDTSGARFMEQPHRGAYAISGVAPHGYMMATDEVLLVPTGRSVPAAFARQTGALLHYHQGANQYHGGVWSVLAGDTYFGWAGVRPPDGPPWFGERQPDNTTSLAGYDVRTGSSVIQMPAVYRLLVRPDAWYAAKPGRIDCLPPLLSAASAGATGLTARVTASDPRLATAKWTVPQRRVYAMAMADNVLLLGGKDEVRAVGADGEEIWRAAVDGQVRGLAVADGRLVVATRGGAITVFDGAAPAARPAAPEVRPDRNVSRRPGSSRGRWADLTRPYRQSKGYALVVGQPDAALAQELAESTGLKCIAVLSDGSRVADERRRLVESTDIYGARLFVERPSAGSGLPYPPFFANLIVVSDADGVDLRDLYRVLRPCGGTMCFVGVSAERARALAAASGAEDAEIRAETSGSVRVVRGRLPGACDWDSSDAPDQRVKWPLALQWFGDPGPAPFTTRHRRPGPPVVANGRAFFRGYHHLIALDAYNGTPLWSREIADIHPGGQEGSVEVAADADSVYLHVGAGTIDVTRSLAARDLVDVGWPDSWRLFGPAPELKEPVAPDELRTVPSSLSLQGKSYAGQTVQAHDAMLNLNRAFGSVKQGQCAYAFGTFTCPKDGRLVVNASANWWMEWFLDGRPVYGTMAAGNNGSPLDLAAHTFVTDVAAGPHVLAVFVKAGRLGWSLKSRGGLALPGSPIVREGLCVRLDAETGKTLAAYGEVARRTRIDLTAPREFPLVIDEQHAGNMTLTRSDSGLECRLTAQTGASSDRHAWHLFFDFRVPGERAAMYGPGAFGIRVETSAHTNGVEVSRISGPTAPDCTVTGAMVRTVMRAVVPDDGPPGVTPSARTPGPGAKKTSNGGAAPVGGPGPVDLDVDDEAGEVPVPVTKTAVRAASTGRVDRPPGVAAGPDSRGEAAEDVRGRSEVVLRFGWDAIRAMTGHDLPKSFGFAAQFFAGRGRERTTWLTAGVFAPSKVVTRGWACVLLDPGASEAEDTAAEQATLERPESMPPGAATRARLPRRSPEYRVIRTHPLTGVERAFSGDEVRRLLYRYYGCGDVSSSLGADWFRSGTVGFYDYADDSGLRNFGGIKPGCGVNMIAALGLLISSPGSAGCACGYNFTGSFALAPTTERSHEDWAIFTDTPADLISAMSLNLGAPGDRRDPAGTMWLAFPRPSAAGLTAGIGVPGAVEADPGEGPYRFNADRTRFEGAAPPWVLASGIEGIRELRLRLVAPPASPSDGTGTAPGGARRPAPSIEPDIDLGNDSPSEAVTNRVAMPTRFYSVCLFFAEPRPDSRPGERVFDVALQGQTVLSRFDIVKEAGAARTGVAREFRGIAATTNLTVSFARADGDRRPLLCGIRVTAEQIKKVEVALALAGEKGVDAAVSALVALGRDPDPDLRSRAVTALARLGDTRPVVLSAFEAAVRDRNAMVRDAGFEAAARLRAATPVLVAAATNEQPEVRRRAIESLGWPTRITEETLPVLQAGARDTNVQVRTAAVAALGGVGGGFPHLVLPALLASAEDRDAGVRVASLHALIALGKAGVAPESLPVPVMEALFGILTKEGAGLAYGAGELLAKVGKPAIPPLVELLRGREGRSAWRAVWTLGKMGRPASETVPMILAEIDRRKDENFTKAAQEALAGIRSEQK